MAMRQKRFLTILGASLLAACASTPPRDPSTPIAGWGESKASAIEVCKPEGQRAYLDQLVCSDGSSPAYRRVGSFGSRNEVPKNLTKEQEADLLQALFTGRALRPGEKDHHIVDGYELSCGQSKRMVYMDMYHCNSAPPKQAPAGFTLRPKVGAQVGTQPASTGAEAAPSRAAIGG